MKRFAFATAGVAGLLGVIVAVGLSGCSQPTTTDSPTAATKPAEAGHEGHMDGDHDHSGMEKMGEGLAKLSESDRAAASKQHMCPVSGEMLGTMGAPLKVTVKEHDVWICCEGCREKLTGDPDKYLAKLKGHEGHGE